MSDSNTLKLTFKNFGGEFQYHRLYKVDIDYLKESFEADKNFFLIRTFLEANLSRKNFGQEAMVLQWMAWKSLMK
jgi:hypothetical protein